MQCYTITHIRLMFDFDHVIVYEWLHVLSKSVFLAQQSVQYIKLKILAIVTS
uniref:Uncharacterized protein n=1 Tax=Lepeophtheirus salmonis TaxID=72036 RepID=A0A0K2V262_LEPSM